MKQKGIVIEATGTTARVKVLRTAMCEGCSQRKDGDTCACAKLMGASREVIASVDNSVGASVGDSVEIESASSSVLLYAAIVFLLPVLGAILFYGLAKTLGFTENRAYIAAAVGLCVSFLPAILVDKLRRGKPLDIRITNILS